MSKLTIVGTPLSTYVRTLRMLCEEKGVDYALDPQPPQCEAVKAINPFGRIPVLRHGDLELAESAAIGRYIDRLFAGPTFFPEAPVAAAKVDQWVSCVNTEFYDFLIRQYLFAYYFPKTDDGQPDRALIDGQQEELQAKLALLDLTVGKNGWLASGDLSFADLNLYPIVFYLMGLPESGEIIKSLGHLNGYQERIAERDSAKATVPPAP